MSIERMESFGDLVEDGEGSLDKPHLTHAVRTSLGIERTLREKKNTLASLNEQQAFFKAHPETGAHMEGLAPHITQKYRALEQEILKLEEQLRIALAREHSAREGGGTA